MIRINKEITYGQIKLNLLPLSILLKAFVYNQIYDTRLLYQCQEVRHRLTVFDSFEKPFY